jgi:hypothetical protein
MRSMHRYQYVSGALFPPVESYSGIARQHPAWFSRNRQQHGSNGFIRGSKYCHASWSRLFGEFRDIMHNQSHTSNFAIGPKNLRNLFLGLPHQIDHESAPVCAALRPQRLNRASLKHEKDTALFSVRTLSRPFLSTSNPLAQILPSRLRLRRPTRLLSHQLTAVIPSAFSVMHKRPEALSVASDLR